MSRRLIIGMAITVPLLVAGGQLIRSAAAPASGPPVRFGHTDITYGKRGFAHVVLKPGERADPQMDTAADAAIARDGSLVFAGESRVWSLDPRGHLSRATLAPLDKRPDGPMVRLGTTSRLLAMNDETVWLLSGEAAHVGDYGEVKAQVTGAKVTAGLGLRPWWSRGTLRAANRGEDVTITALAQLADGQVATCVHAPAEETLNRYDELLRWTADGGDSEPEIAPVWFQFDTCELLLASGDGAIIGGRARGRSGERGRDILVKVGATFTPDSTWGNDGVLQLPAGTGLRSSTFAALPDGSVIIVARRWQTGRDELMKLAANGTLDTRFGRQGTVELPTRLQAERVDAMTVGVDGVVYVASHGRQDSHGRRGTTRVNRVTAVDGVSGRLVRGFAGTGIVTTLIDALAVRAVDGARPGLVIAGNGTVCRTRCRTVATAQRLGLGKR